jgi:putative ABC transport system permease protein
MIKNYVRVALRNFRKNKFLTILNVAGLALGMCACFFVFQYVYYESSYDQFHKNANRLYRVGIRYADDPTDGGSAGTHPATGRAMKAELPQVEDFTRMFPLSVCLNSSMPAGIQPRPETIVSTHNNTNDQISFHEENIFLADSSFFHLFSYPFLQGNPTSALTTPNSIVISASTAKKYFGNENALGKTLQINGQWLLNVTGIFQDVPANSHIHFDMLISLVSIDQNFINDRWTWPEFYNYVLLRPNANPKEIEGKFPEFVERHMGEIMKHFGFKVSFFLTPLNDIHLSPKFFYEPQPQSSKSTMLLLAIIGGIVLFIAWINYINLAMATFLQRGKEVGLRKVVGAKKFQLIGQFITEAVLLNTFALVLSVIFSFIFFYVLNEVFQINILNFLITPLWRSSAFWIVFFFVFATGAIATGAYPAVILSRLKSINVLKEKYTRAIAGISLRKLLVTIQFGLSIILAAGTITVYRQLNFMQQSNPGYNRDQVLIVRAPVVYSGDLGGRISTFKNEILQNPSVRKVSFASDVPGKALTSFNSLWTADVEESSGVSIFMMEVDDEFIPTFDINIAAGRNFTTRDSISIHGATNAKIMINETLARQLGFRKNEDAINKDVLFRPDGYIAKAQIIAVVKDYHQQSMKSQIDPIAYYYPSWNHWRYICVEVSGQNVERSIAGMEEIYGNVFPGNNFDTFFMDEYFQKQYKADRDFSNIVLLFTMIAIFIAAMGVLGLTSLMVHVRVKEIGIRRILGASVAELLLLLSKDFLRLVLIAYAIAVPVIYYFAGNWLQNFAFHINLSWITWVAPLAILVTICVATIVLRSWKVAATSPTKTLRTE